MPTLSNYNNVYYCLPEQAKKLLDLGIDGKPFFTVCFHYGSYYDLVIQASGEVLFESQHDSDQVTLEPLRIPIPNASELDFLLPAYCSTILTADGWICSRKPRNQSFGIPSSTSGYFDTPAAAKADLLIQLLEGEVLKAADANYCFWQALAQALIRNNPTPPAKAPEDDNRAQD